MLIEFMTTVTLTMGYSLDGCSFPSNVNVWPMATKNACVIVAKARAETFSKEFPTGEAVLVCKDNNEPYFTIQVGDK